MEEFLRYNMYHDALTDLYNRRFLERQIGQNAENLAVRWGGEEFILYYQDASVDSIKPLMEDLRQRVDEKLYLGKQQGRNRVVT